MEFIALSNALPGRRGRGVSGHRYWRILFGNGHFPSSGWLQEVELRSTVGGADITSPSTTRTQVDIINAHLCHDNTAGASAEISASANPATVTFDFGAGNTPSVVQVAITAGATQNFIPWGHVLYSDDGTNFTLAYEFTTTTAWTANEQRTFAAP
jgi:hypothetical protein